MRALTKYRLGQVGGFPLRLSWLPRFVNMYRDKPVPRNHELVARELGMGKNMAKSLAVWAAAVGIITKDRERLEPLAEYLFIQHDPFLERGESVALLHWLIAANMKNFTANVWLFNYFHARKFSSQDAVASFSRYLSSQNATYAVGTITVDVETAVRMHIGVHDRELDDDVGDRFFYPLRLLAKTKIDGRTVFSRTWEEKRHQVTPKLLLYAIIQSLAQRRSAKASLIADLYEPQAEYAGPGTVFGLTKDGFFIMVEDIAKEHARQITLHPMPGGDVTIQLKGALGRPCEKGDAQAANEFFFKSVG